MRLNLPRHESNTLLRAVLTAKDLLTESVVLEQTNDLKNLTESVNYYIILFIIHILT